MNREQIAQVAHEVNRAYCASLGDTSQPAWAEAPEWQRASALAGVDMHLAKPEATPEESHLSWYEQKLADGWVYGEVKDPEKKEHPCMRPYEELPPEQRAKDYLFRGVVHALAALPAAAQPPANQPLPAGLTVAAVGVKYVGRRDSHHETLYGSGTWAQGQVKAVAAALSRQLLKHRDMFEEAQLESPAALETIVQPVKAGETPDEQTQDLRDQIQNMDKAALKELAMTRYRVKVDGRLSLTDTRAHLTLLVDRFGAG
ncbi:RyR domain-containing protein [Variovorax sp. V15]|uniref:RyR domain-containing protein n=1 Tax=Variovorax sp. V15 TaxID=3065952 RepID=UPI0034E89262